MKMIERYSVAVNADNLKTDVRTTYGPTDVLGAVGIASLYEPLGVALARFFAGGGNGDLVNVMAKHALHRSKTIKGCRISKLQAHDIATSVIAWYLHGRCNDCGGTGFALIPDTPHLSDKPCKVCEGTGKLVFVRQFRHEWRELALWMKDEIERSQNAAAQIAMKKIAALMDC